MNCKNNSVFLEENKKRGEQQECYSSNDERILYAAVPYYTWSRCIESQNPFDLSRHSPRHVSSDLKRIVARHLPRTNLVK